MEIRSSQHRQWLPGSARSPPDCFASPRISISHWVNWRNRPLCGRSARHTLPDLQRLERGWQLIHMIGIISCTEARSDRSEGRCPPDHLLLCASAIFSFSPAFHDLKDQLLIVSALPAAQILDMFHTRRLH